MWCDGPESEIGSVLLDDVPNQAFGHAFTPTFPGRAFPVNLTALPNFRLARYPGRIAFSTFVVTTSAVVGFAPILR